MKTMFELGFANYCAKMLESINFRRQRNNGIERDFRFLIN
jgi:hypothetical protein